MENNSYGQQPQQPSGFGILNIIFILLGIAAIYYLYRFLYTSTNSTATTIIGGQQSASMPPSSIPKPPPPFEGGEYSVSTWIYINSFNKNRNTRKHILELQGEYFSTLLVALGAFKNTVTIRTHSDDIIDGFQDGSDEEEYDVPLSDTGSGDIMTTRRNGNTPDSTAPPNANPTGDLSADSVEALFAPIAMDDDLLKTPLPCDLKEIDLQRWTMLTVVLSGRTIDVYIDGKLQRSCVGESYYKVDPTGVTMNLLDRGGFDGYIGHTVAGAYGMNPDEIYRMYLSGPNGTSMDVISWFVSLFKGA